MKLVRGASTRSPLRARGRVPVRRLLEKAPAASALPGRSPPLPSLAPPLISAEDPTLSHPRPTPHLAFHHRLAQGAAAAGTFSSKGVIAGAYADGTETHKTTEEVESYWMGVIEKERADAEAAGAERPREGANALPWGFEQRAKIREAEAKAYGAADGGRRLRVRRPDAGLRRRRRRAVAVARRRLRGRSARPTADDRRHRGRRDELERVSLGRRDRARQGGDERPGNTRGGARGEARAARG
jgi:hypothetical protein